MNDEWPWVCDDCDEHVDEGKSLCEECGEKRYAEWLRHQDWLKTSDRERDDLIRSASR